MNGAYVVIWEYAVEASRCEEFEAAYGPVGPWASLFARADGFVEVVLLRCAERAGRYLTFDRWTSTSAFDAFARSFATDYHALDEQLAGIAASQTRIGAFLTTERGFVRE